MLPHPRLIAVLTLYWNLLSRTTLTVHDTSSSKSATKIVLELHWLWDSWLVIMGQCDYKPCTSKYLTKSRKKILFLGRWVLLGICKQTLVLTLTDLFFQPLIVLWMAKPLKWWSWEIPSIHPSATAGCSLLTPVLCAGSVQIASEATLTLFCSCLWSVQEEAQKMGLRQWGSATILVGRCNLVTYFLGSRTPGRMIKENKCYWQQKPPAEIGKYFTMWSYCHPWN